MRLHGPQSHHLPTKMLRTSHMVPDWICNPALLGGVSIITLQMWKVKLREVRVTCPGCSARVRSGESDTMCMQLRPVLEQSSVRGFVHGVWGKLVVCVSCLLKHRKKLCSHLDKATLAIKNAKCFLLFSPVFVMSAQADIPRHLLRHRTSYCYFRDVPGSFPKWGK